jgi:L-fuculose-phosphate aldolase
MDRSGLTEATAGNLSARTSADEVVLTPTALDYAEMTTEDLVVCDLEGRVVSGTRAPTTEAGLHLACLRRHRDIAAVVHSHALHASQFAVTHQPIPCLVEEFELYVGGDVPIAPYRQTGSEALGEVVAPLLADRSAALLANHGLVSVGATPGEALGIAKLVERTAQIVAGARRLGEPVPLPDASRSGLAARYQAARAERAKRLHRS